jgi:hypothetical protein
MPPRAFCTWMNSACAIVVLLLRLGLLDLARLPGITLVKQVA